MSAWRLAGSGGSLGWDALRSLTVVLQKRSSDLRTTMWRTPFHAHTNASVVYCKSPLALATTALRAFGSLKKILYFQLMDRQNLRLPISLQILSYHSCHFGTRLCGFTYSWDMDRQNMFCSAHSVYPFLKNVCGHSILNQKGLEFEGFRPFSGLRAFVSGIE